MTNSMASRLRLDHYHEERDHHGLTLPGQHLKISLSHLAYKLISYPSHTTGACYDPPPPPPPPSTLKTTREESKMSNFHTTLFQNSFVLVS